MAEGGEEEGDDDSQHPEQAKAGERESTRRDSRDSPRLALLLHSY